MAVNRNGAAGAYNSCVGVLSSIAVLVIVGLASAWAQVAAGIHIERVRFRLETPVRGVELDKCASGMVSRTYEGPNWEAQSAEQIRECLQDHGYFKATVITSSEQLPDKNDTHQFAVTFEIDQGLQYRISGIGFKNNRAISTPELRGMFHFRDGDLLRLSAIRDGISRMKQAYNARGYPLFTPIPDFQFDDKAGTIALTIDIDEGKQAQ